MTVRMSLNPRGFPLAQPFLQNTANNVQSLYLCPAHVYYGLAHSALLGTFCTPRRTASHLPENRTFSFCTNRTLSFCVYSLSFLLILSRTFDNLTERRAISQML